MPVSTYCLKDLSPRTFGFQFFGFKAPTLTYPDQFFTIAISLGFRDSPTFI